MNTPLVDSLLVPGPQAEGLKQHRENSGEGASFSSVLQSSIQHDRASEALPVDSKADVPESDFSLQLSAEALLDPTQFENLLSALESLDDADLLKLAEMLLSFGGESGDEEIQVEGSNAELEELASLLLGQLQESLQQSEGEEGLLEGEESDLLQKIIATLDFIRAHSTSAEDQKVSLKTGPLNGEEKPVLPDVFEVTPEGEESAKQIKLSETTNAEAENAKAQVLTDGEQATSGKAVAQGSEEGQKLQQNQEGDQKNQIKAQSETAIQLKEGGGKSENSEVTLQDTDETSEETLINKKGHGVDQPRSAHQAQVAAGELRQKVLDKINDIVVDRSSQNKEPSAELKELKQLLEQAPKNKGLEQLANLSKQAQVKTPALQVQQAEMMADKNLKEGSVKTDVSLQFEDETSSKQEKVVLQTSKPQPSHQAFRLQHTYGVGQTKVFISPEVGEMKNNVMPKVENMMQLPPDMQISEDQKPKENAPQEKVAEVAAKDQVPDAQSEVKSAEKPAPVRHRFGQEVMTKFLNSTKDALKLWVQKNFVAMKVQIEPAELGKIELRTAIENGRIGVSVQAESQAAKELLTQHVNELKEVLKEQGLEVVGFNIELKQNLGGGFADDYSPQKTTRKFEMEALLESEGEEELVYYKSSLFDKVA